MTTHRIVYCQILRLHFLRLSIDLFGTESISRKSITVNFQLLGVRLNRQRKIYNIRQDSSCSSWSFMNFCYSLRNSRQIFLAFFMTKSLICDSMRGHFLLKVIQKNSLGDRFRIKFSMKILVQNYQYIYQVHFESVDIL